jgi:large subunit ribosomal protein L23
MALFKKDTTKKEKKVAKPAAEKTAAPEVSVKLGYAEVLANPRITEKATLHGMSGVYTFDVPISAGKNEIKKAVQALYKVTPRMVRVVRIRAKVKRSARTGKTGMTSAGKKAYVYLKKGETIEIV